MVQASARRIQRRLANRIIQARRWFSSPRHARAATALIGLAVFALGVAAVFLTGNDAAAVALISLGAAAVAFAVLGDRIESVGFGGPTLTLTEVARETFALAKDAEQRGETNAEHLHAVARSLRGLASRYEILRTIPAGDERTGAMDELVEDVGGLAPQVERAGLTTDDVVRWFEGGTEGARLVTLGLMQLSPALRDFVAAYDAIAHSWSANEQYHAMKLALAMAASKCLRPYEQVLLRKAILNEYESGQFGPCGARATVARELLTLLGNGRGIDDCTNGGR